MLQDLYTMSSVLFIIAAFLVLIIALLVWYYSAEIIASLLPRQSKRQRQINAVQMRIALESIEFDINDRVIVTGPKS